MKVIKQSKFHNKFSFQVHPGKKAFSDFGYPLNLMIFSLKYEFFSGMRQYKNPAKNLQPANA